MNGPSLLTLDQPDGSRIAMLLPVLSESEQALFDEVFDRWLADHPGLDLAKCMVVLMEQIHEDEMYRRACERRGLLPL